MIDLLLDNVLLLVGLGFGALLLGLKTLSAKTETKIDDEIVVKIEENKKPIVDKIAGLLISWLQKKK